MAGSNTFPLNIVARQDASFAGTLKGIETTVEGTFARIGIAGENALRRATRFDFSAARRDLDGLKQSMDRLATQRATASADPFGIKASVAALKASPFRQVINDQIAAEASLAQQKNATIQRELEAGLGAIRERQAAQTAAFAQAEQQGQSLIALDKQRAAEMAKLVAAPSSGAQAYFDPSGAQSAAAAARTYATNLAEVAAASERVVASGQAVTTTDRAQAVALREAAQAADLDANRLEALATTQAKVAAAAGEAAGRFAAGQSLMARSSNASRIAGVQAGQQLQDFAIQIQGGINPLVALSQQGSQLAFVLSQTGGTAGKFASFLAGPWGAGIIVATTVLGPLIANVLGLGEANDTSSAALKSNEQAIRDNAQALADSIQSTQAAEVSKLAHARSMLADELHIRANTKALLENALAQAAIDRTRATAPGQRGELATLALDKSSSDAAALTELARKQDAAIKTAQTGVRLAEIPIARRRVNERTDPAAAATGQFERAQARLDAQLAKGRIDQQAYEAGLTAAQAKRDAAILAANKVRSSVGGSHTSTLNAQARLDAADGTLERARAELALTKATGAELLKQGKISEGTYKARVQAAQSTVNQAENAKRTAAAGRTAANDAKREAAELAANLTQVADKYDGVKAAAIEYGKEVEAINALAKAGPDKGGITEVEAERYRAAALVEKNRKEEEARAAAVEASLTPYQRASAELGNQLVISTALAAGDERRADILQLQAQLQDRFKVSAQEALELATRQVDAEDALAAKRRLNAQLIGIQVRAAQDLQAALTDAITRPFAKGSITRFTDALTGIRQRRVAEELTLKLLGGDLGDKVHDALTRNAQPLTDSANAHLAAAAKWDVVADKIGELISGRPGIEALTTTPTAFGASGLPDLGALIGNSGIAGNDNDIIVTAQRLPQIVSDDASGTIKLGIDASGLDLGNARVTHGRLEDALSKFEAPLTYIAGAVGGRGAALINSALNIPEYRKLGDTIGEALDKTKFGAAISGRASNAIAGIGQGQTADAIVKLLGGRGSTTGASIGGALGGAVGGPIGAFVGGTLGSLIGGLFKKTKTGSATITSIDGGISTSGNNAGLKSSSSAAAGQLQDQLGRIISSLGATAGSFAVSIGQRKDNYVVDTSGAGRTKGSGTLSFKTEAEAYKAALVNAIQDGAVAGIREGAQRLLRAGTDLDRQLQKAVDFQGVFQELKQRTDPVGAAIDALDKQFDYLRSVFAEAGASTAEYADLEKLYGLKRAEAIKAAQEDITSTLQSLLDDLRYKGDSGLSLRTREANAFAAFNPLAATVRAGGKVDQTEFADAAKAVLDIERQIYGSSQQYFAKLADITALTGQAITNAGGTIKGGPIVANDNLKAEAAATAQAIYAQTDALRIPAGSAALFTSAQFTDAVAAAFTSPVAAAANAGATTAQPSNADVVAAIRQQTMEQNEVTRAGFELMIRTMTSAGGGGAGPDCPLRPAGRGGSPYTLASKEKRAVLDALLS